MEFRLRHIKYATIFRRMSENYNSNKLTLQIQTIGLITHSVFCGLYAYTAYSYSIVGSTITRLGFGLIGVIPPLMMNLKKLNKAWLLSFLLWYAAESLILMLNSFLQNSFHGKTPLAIATTSTLLQTTIAGLVFLRRS